MPLAERDINVGTKTAGSGEVCSIRYGRVLKAPFFDSLFDI